MYESHMFKRVPEFGKNVPKSNARKAICSQSRDSEKIQHTHATGLRTNPCARQSARRLLTQAELVNNGLVAFGIVCLQIVQQATTLADQHEKAAA